MQFINHLVHFVTGCPLHPGPPLQRHFGLPGCGWTWHRLRICQGKWDMTVHWIGISDCNVSNCCWEIFGLRRVEKRSSVKRVLHLDVSTLWVVFSHFSTFFNPNKSSQQQMTLHCHRNGYGGMSLEHYSRGTLTPLWEIGNSGPTAMSKNVL